MTRHGTPVAAVVSIGELQRIWQIGRGRSRHDQPAEQNSHIVGAPFARLVQKTFTSARW
jgi:hypothetical protein